MVDELTEDLHEASLQEIWLTSLASITPPVYTVFGGKHKALRSHGTAFNSDPYEMLHKLTKVLDGEQVFLLIIISHLTDNQYNEMKKILRASTNIKISVKILDTK